VLNHYLRTLYRSLSRQKLYAVLNVGGLAVGIAVFLILSLVVRYELAFDRWVPNVEQIYRLNVDTQFPGTPPQFSSNTQGVVAPLLKEDYPQIEAVTRVMHSRTTIKIDGRSLESDLSFVDPDFFDVFALPLIAGDPEAALRDPASVVLVERLAKTLYPDGGALGRALELTINGQTRAFTVTAVAHDLPDESSLDVSMMVPLSRSYFSEERAESVFENWGSFNMSTFVRIADSQAAHTVNADLRRFVSRRVPPDALPTPTDEVVRYSLMPLTQVHFADARDPNAQRSADAADVAVLGLVGLMTLIIAAINYVNLATARAGLRAREVAVRKTLGATRQMLAIQFLIEGVLLAAVAGLVGLALTELTLPVVNAYGGTNLKLTYWGLDGVVVLATFAILAVGLGAGIWPALVLSSFAPAGVLASARSPGGGKLGSRVRGSLVLIQFTVALVFSICTAVMLEQSHHLRTADLGFSREGLLIQDRFASPDLDTRRSALLDQYRRLPNVLSATVSDRSPATGSVSSTNVSRPGHVGEEPALVVEVIGPDYFQTYGANLVAGRAFDPRNRLDDARAEAGDDPWEGGVGHNVMLSQSALPVLGFADAQKAIGQTVRFAGKPMTVIGVVRDVRFRSPRDQIPAVVYRYRSDEIPGGVAAVRFRGDPAMVRGVMETTWRSFAPAVPFEAKTVAQMLEPYYTPEDQRSRLFVMGASVAILIGALGLYGMAAFVTARRTREIGIRKTLGASTREVLGLLVGQFLRPVGVAALIGCPLAFVLMSRWLDRFDDRVSLSLWVFLIPVIGAVFIAVFTVLGHAVVTARSEPAKALRSL
jgi:putative ABC transport system permease protein